MLRNHSPKLINIQVGIEKQEAIKVFGEYFSEHSLKKLLLEFPPTSFGQIKGTYNHYHWKNHSSYRFSRSVSGFQHSQLPKIANICFKSLFTVFSLLLTLLISKGRFINYLDEEFIAIFNAFRNNSSLKIWDISHVSFSFRLHTISELSF